MLSTSLHPPSPRGVLRGGHHSFNTREDEDSRALWDIRRVRSQVRRNVKTLSYSAGPRGGQELKALPSRNAARLQTMLTLCSDLRLPLTLKKIGVLGS